MTLRAFALALLLVVVALAAPGATFAANSTDSTAGPAAVDTYAVPAAAAAVPHVNVAIQAGHWKTSELPDPLKRLRTSTGTSGGGRTEPQLNLDIAQRVVRLLQAEGLTAEVLPATVPTGYTADLFISLHADGNSSTRPRGYKVSTRWRSDVAALDALLVQSIEDKYPAITGMPQDPSVTRAMRGYYAYSTYRGQDYRLGSTTPAAILEMGFMSNATDRNLMFNSPNLIAKGIVAGIDEFYARRAEGQRLQAAALRAASASQYGRSVVVLPDGANIRATGSTAARKLDSADFGDSFPLLQADNSRPGGGSGTAQPQFNPQGGTQLVTADSWYKITIPGQTDPAYISRDVVVVQQAPR